MKIDRKVCYKFGKKFTLEDGKTAFYFKKMSIIKLFGIMLDYRLALVLASLICFLYDFTCDISTTGLYILIE